LIFSTIKILSRVSCSNTLSTYKSNNSNKRNNQLNKKFLLFMVFFFYLFRSFVYWIKIRQSKWTTHKCSKKKWRSFLVNFFILCFFYEFAGLQLDITSTCTRIVNRTEKILKKNFFSTELMMMIIMTNG
jgi:hypothetical protein